ncbi:MAG: hypothetical protein NT098_00445 [Candidatus Parcubacteria bacterium]|nr:hypothetical protein [Candidatus Parcubacteria bacterium]
MKKKHFFAIALFSLIPISAFAVYGESYGLTAQGNEGKLTAAKGTFLWSCVGFGVLLGAWLFSTAFVGMMTAITGGNAEVVTITACDESKTVVAELLSINPIVAQVHDTDLAKNAGVTGNLSECHIGKPSPLADVMKENGLDPADSLLFSKSKTIVHNDALLKNTEQSYLLMEIGDNSGYLFHTASGDEQSVATIGTSQLGGFIDTTLPATSRVTYFHSHPSAFATGKVPPSSQDLTAEYLNHLTALSGRTIPTRFMVSDANGIWEYSIPQGSKYAQVLDTVRQKTKEFSDLPAIKSVTEEGWICSTGAIIVSLETDALNGKYGEQPQQIARTIYDASQELAPLNDQDERLLASTSGTERISILNEREVTLRSLGVLLQYTPMQFQ